MNTIEYPAGETLIEAWRIPHGIATCLAPEPERGDDTKPHARAKHLHVLLEQEKALDAAFKMGRIPMLTVDRVPAKRYSEAALVAVAAARAYLEPLGFELVEGVPEHIAAEYAELREQAERQKEASKAAGRYTLEEAANLLEKEAGERAGPMLDKLKAAAASRALPTYKPGKNARYAGKVVREFYEEAHAEDLNAWLEANEPRIVWRFTLGSLPPGAIATMREMGWSEARIEAERQAAERIRAAGGFQNWVVMCEAARIASEARGYTVQPENFKGVRRFETEAERLADIAQDELHASTPQLWAWYMSAELRERNPGMDYAAQGAAEVQILRTFGAHAETLPLRQMPSGLPWPKGEPLPPNWREGLYMTKAELRAWAKEHAPDLLGSALLAEPKSAPAAEAATVAGPGKMGNSTKPSKSHFLAAQIRSAQEQAENASDAAARWERGAVWTALRAMALEGSEPFTGMVHTKGLEYTDAANCKQVFTPEALAAYLKRQREK